MTDSHAIRLRGPWQYEVCERFVEKGDLHAIEPSGRVNLPRDWSEPPWGNVRGRLRFTRTFNWPKPLAAHQRIALVFEVGGACESAVLNGRRLLRFDGVEQQARVDVTDRIARYNTLTIEVERVKSEDGEGEAALGIIGEVYLEVSPDA